MQNNKVVILAGGFGRRLLEKTNVTPKPMIQIGGIPIIQHIINHYAHYGLKNFVLCLGYKKDKFKKIWQ